MLLNLLVYFGKVLRFPNKKEAAKDNNRSLREILNIIDEEDVDPWKKISLQARAKLKNTASSVADIACMKVMNLFKPDEVPQVGVLRTLSQWQIFKQKALTVADVNLAEDYEDNFIKLEQFINVALQNSDNLTVLINIIETIERLIETNVQILKKLGVSLTDKHKKYLNTIRDTNVKEYINVHWSSMIDPNDSEHLIRLGDLRVLVRGVFKKEFNEGNLNDTLQLFKDLLPVTEILKINLTQPKEVTKQHQSGQKINFSLMFLDLLNNIPDNGIVETSEFFIFESVLRPLIPKRYSRPVSIPS